MPKIVFAANKLMTCSILGISFFLLLMSFFFVYKQRNHKSFSFLFLRLLSYFIAIISLALAGLQPQIQTEIATEKNAFILNHSNHLDSVAQIIEQTPIADIFSIKQPIQNDENSIIDTLHSLKIQAIPNLSYLAKQQATKEKFTNLAFFGEGLETHELALLDSFPQVKLHLNKPPHGIHNIAWQRYLRIGETLLLQGKFYHENAEKSYKVVLKGFGQALDSVLISPTKNKSFSEFRFQHQNKIAGKQTFQLFVKNEFNEVVAEHDIPFISYKQNISNILVLVAEPTFEIKFLKNFLAKNKIGVAVRQKISREIYKTEFLNLETEKDLKNLSTNLLNNFDCLILDIETLKGFSAEETKNLKKVCQNEGLSILLLLDDSFVKKEYEYQNILNKHHLFKSFELKKNNLLTQNKITLQAAENPKSELLNANNLKYYIATKTKQQAIFQTTNKQAAIAFQQLALGRVAINTIPKTYVWALSGNEATYEQFWNVTLENLIVNYTPSSDFVIKEQLPIVGFPLHFRYQNELRNDVIIWQNPKGESFELSSSELVDEMAFVSKFWPKEKGWHRLSLKDKPQKRLDFYVYDESNWRAYRSAKKLNETAAYLVDNQDVAKGSVKPILKEKNLQNIPLFWFYIAFLIGISALWISEKFAT